MDANVIITMIGSLGFPICACIGLGWFVTSELRSMRSDHKEEMAKMTEAINNNNLLLQRILDRLDKEGDV